MDVFVLYTMISNRHNTDIIFSRHQMPLYYWPRKVTSLGFQFPSRELLLPGDLQECSIRDQLKLYLFSQNITSARFIHQESESV